MKPLLAVLFVLTAGLGTTQITSIPTASVATGTWSGTGSCGVQSAYCAQSAEWTPSRPIKITQVNLLMFGGQDAGCTTAPGAIQIVQNSNFGSPLVNIPMANGTQKYASTGLSVTVTPANGPIILTTASTPASGCDSYASGPYYLIEYQSL